MINGNMQEVGDATNCWLRLRQDNIWWEDEWCKANWETRGTATRPNVGGVYQKRRYCPGCRDKSDLIKFNERGTDRQEREHGDCVDRRAGEINLNLQRI